jgi:8-oxo-dGTP diphosphatase
MLSEEVNFCPRCGAGLEDAERIGALRRVCPNCDWIYFADPKVAVAALVVKDRKVLLVRRAHSPKQGYWTLPAGFVDAGEDPARAAERECVEETGLEVRVNGLVDVLAGQEHARGAHILIVYRAEIVSGRERPGDDADQVGFFDLNDLPALAFSTTQQILGNLTKLEAK